MTKRQAEPPKTLSVPAQLPPPPPGPTPAKEHVKVGGLKPLPPLPASSWSWPKPPNPPKEPIRKQPAMPWPAPYQPPIPPAPPTGPTAPSLGVPLGSVVAPALVGLIPTIGLRKACTASSSGDYLIKPFQAVSPLSLEPPKLGGGVIADSGGELEGGRQLEQQAAPIAALP